jgi:hypothetical protein
VSRLILTMGALLTLVLPASAAEVTYDVRPAGGASSPVEVAAGATVAYEVTIAASELDNDGLLLFIFDLLTDLGVDQSTDSIVFDPLIKQEFGFLPMQYGDALGDDIFDIGATQGFHFQATTGIGQGGAQVLIRGQVQTPAEVGSFLLSVGPTTNTQLIAAGGGDLIPDTDITTQFGPGLLIQTLPDADADGVADGDDNCPSNPNADQQDTDGDEVGDACDECYRDANKVAPGACGCGLADTDSDGDGLPDCHDPTPHGEIVSDGVQPEIIAPAGCGAGVGLANLAGFGMLCGLGLAGLRTRRPG